MHPLTPDASPLGEEVLAKESRQFHVGVVRDTADRGARQGPRRCAAQGQPVMAMVHLYFADGLTAATWQT